MQQPQEVIIIGSGISGLGASKTLTQFGIPHIILESRDRIGGRIQIDRFAGVMVDIGATFIHSPGQGNQIYQFVKDKGLKTIQASREDEYYYQGLGRLDDDEEQRVEQLYKEAYEAIEGKVKHLEADLSIAEALEEFIDQELDGEEPSIRDTVLWKLTIEGNIEGAELSELSAQKPSVEEKKNDLLPLEGGYPMLVEKIFGLCKTQIRYNTKVQAIDYSDQLVRVYTTNGQYTAKKVISSLPLGVLQQGKVQFIPSLPQSYQTAISSIGNGNEQKLFCLFKKPFWGAKEGWINFVTKKKNNPYPIGFIYPNQDEINILLLFVAGNNSKLIEKWDDSKIQLDVFKFLSRFIEPQQIKLEEVRLSRWHTDQHSLGSYCFNKVGTKIDHFHQLRAPLQNKVWFVGQHTHPTLSSYAHGAYETGINAALEVKTSLRGHSVIPQESEQNQH